MHTALLWDISPTISSTLPVWPGDTRFETGATWEIGPGCPLHVRRNTVSIGTDATSLNAQTSKTPGAHHAAHAILHSLVPPITSQNA